MNLYSKEDACLYKDGNLLKSYKLLGSHTMRYNGEDGVRFVVWAPNAKIVNVVGNFNKWESHKNPMNKIGSTGMWITFISDAKEKDIYKYEIVTTDKVILKADPYAFFSELRPNTASCIYSLEGYNWSDDKWVKNRQSNENMNMPINIYEVHLGSWKKKQNEEFYTYEELGDELVNYVKDMGYTHIEILPVMEHPYDGSWGYQITGYYAATSRYGEPKQLMSLIDKCHEKGIGVILDWVPGHFCKDNHGLYKFNGDYLYGMYEQHQWGTMNFNFGRKEVENFLISNALFWLDYYHVDGLRVDSVSSMLYLNYGYDDDDLSAPKNIEGGYENLDAIKFLKKLNKTINKEYKNVLKIAEESSTYPFVTGKDEKSLGFDYKWNMGWMNDTLKYMELNPICRKNSHNIMTFSISYAYSENFILPLSHDEVVHGKKSLVSKMQGDYFSKFAQLRLLFVYMIMHPGKKLMFMGGEFAQFIEWKDSAGLDWLLFDYEMHTKFQLFVKKINRLYIGQKALWEKDNEYLGFDWVDADNSSQSIFIFKRSGNEDFLIVILNYMSIAYQNYKIGVPIYDKYTILINTDRVEFGGKTIQDKRDIIASKNKWHNHPYSIKLDIAPLSAQIIKIKDKEREKNNFPFH